MVQVDVQKYELQGVTCTQRMKAGAALGFVVGITIGGLFGGSAALRHGIRGRDAVIQVGKNMLNAGASFGIFMGIGSMLRC